MVRFTALFLTVMTGFSGLVYEVTWQKYLATLLGSHSEATATVLALYLGGLSVGYALFGTVTRRLVASAQRARRPARLLLIYGIVEGAIGLYALLFPTLFGVAQQLSLLVPFGITGVTFGFDVLLSALLIGPPTILMGGTIPVLTLALAGDLQNSTRVHAWVYGFNTVGAFAGALSAAFWLVPALGLDGTLYLMAGANLVAGGSFLLLDRRAGDVVPDFDEGAQTAIPPRYMAFAAVALLGGFAMMALQAAFNRIAALAFGSSPFTFAMIVAVFVLCIAVGSLIVSLLPRIPHRLLEITQWVLFVLLLALYTELENVSYWGHVLRAMFQTHDAAFYPYHIFVFGSLLAVLAIPIGLSGALLPLIFDHLRRDVADLGAVAGRLYAINTFGSLLGALLGGYLLFIWLDLHHIYRIALAALALGAVILSALNAQRSVPFMACFTLAPAWLLLMALPAWDGDRMTMGLYRVRDANRASFRGPEHYFGGLEGQQKLVFHDDDPNSTVTVTQIVEGPGEGSHSIVVNGKSDGNLIGDYTTMAMAGLLPALFTETPERSFVIGWGTGVTGGELAELEGSRSVEVAEISRAVIDAAPIFDYGNHGASKHEKIQVRRGDAYRTLLKAEGNYDIIISEPSNPWVTGVEMLFSRDFFEAAKSRLAPGGVYAQWVQLYEIDTPTVQLVLRTFASVFPHTSIWFAQGADTLMLGFADPEAALDLEALEERFRRPDFAAGFKRCGINDFAALLAHELLPLHTLNVTPSPGEIHTLRHPILTHRAARAFFRGSSVSVPRAVDAASRATGAENSLLRRYMRESPRASPCRSACSSWPCVRPVFWGECPSARPSPRAGSTPIPAPNGGPPSWVTSGNATWGRATAASCRLWRPCTGMGAAAPAPASR